MTRLVTWLFWAFVAFLFVVLALWRVEQAIVRRSTAAARTAVTGPIAVELTPVAARDLAGGVLVSGTLRSVDQVDVVSDVPGRVETLAVDVGSRVSKGDLLATLDDTDAKLALAQAEGAVTAATAAWDAASHDAGSAEQLAAAKAMTETQLVAARSRLAAAQGQLAQAKAGRDLARERVRDARITSPIDGVVTRRGLSIGQMVAPGAPILQAQDDARYQVDVALDEATAHAVAPDQQVTITSLARGGEPLVGTIATVSSTLDPVSHRATAVIRVDATSALITNATVSVRIPIASHEGALAVPATAVVEKDDKPVVRVVTDGVVANGPVTLGIRDGTFVEVGGVAAGAMVVTAGPVEIADGAVVAAGN